MVNKLRIMLLLLLFSVNLDAVEINNFKSGLVCTDGKSVSWICHEVNDIYLTGQSVCIFNKQKVPCNWYGFEFDYINNKPNEKIKCEYSHSGQINMGNPDAVKSKDVSSGIFEFELKEEKGHFFNPQYSGFAIRPIEKSLQTQYTKCSSDGKLLFEYTYNFHHPVLNEK